MTEINELENERAILKLVVSCSTLFDEYNQLLNKAGFTFTTPQRLELFVFCAFIPYLTIMLKAPNEGVRNEQIISFMSALLEYKPKQMTDHEFEIMIEAQQSDEEGGTVLDYIHAYYESWIHSLQNTTIEEDKKISHAISGIHIKLSNRLAYLSDEYQSLEEKRFEAMDAGKAVDMMKIMRQQSDLENSVTLKYMTQIQNFLNLTFTHLTEANAVFNKVS